MAFKKQIYAQIDPNLYKQLVAYKHQTGKSMREILEEALKMMFRNLKRKKPLRGRELIKHAEKYMHNTGKKEDVVSKIDEIVYGS